MADEVGDRVRTSPKFLPYLHSSIDYTPANNALHAPNAVYLLHLHSVIPQGWYVSLTPNTTMPFGSSAQIALKAIGIPNHHRFSLRRTVRFSIRTFTIDTTDTIQSPSKASYLQAAFTRNGRGQVPNLEVYVRALAEWVLFNDNSGSKTYFINVTREVILSAGAFQSPRLFMVSGIGPSARPAEYSISIIADRPGVG